MPDNNELLLLLLEWILIAYFPRYTVMKNFLQLQHCFPRAFSGGSFQFHLPDTFLPLQRLDCLKCLTWKRLGKKQSKSKCPPKPFVNTFYVLCQSPGMAGRMLFFFFDNPNRCSASYIHQTYIGCNEGCQVYISLSHNSKHLFYYCHIFVNTGKARKKL